MINVRPCEVCNELRELRVRSSPIAPVSFGYCSECLEKGLEPYSSLVGLIMCVSMEDIHKEIYEFILYNLKEQGVSFDQFMRDVQKAEDDFHKWCETQMEVY